MTSLLRLLTAILLTMVSAAKTVADDAVNDADRASVRIVAYSDAGVTLGSGFLINRQGHILTSLHVVDRATEIYVFQNADGESIDFRAKVVGTSYARDLAILQARRLRGEPATIFVGTPQKGDDVFTLGYPTAADVDNLDTESGDFAVSSHTRGTIRRTVRRNISRSGAMISLVQHTAPISPGDSGGALYDACGRVLGVNVHLIEGGRGGAISEAIASDEITAFFRVRDFEAALDAEPCFGVPATQTAAADAPDSATGRGEEPAWRRGPIMWLVIAGGAAALLAIGVLIFLLRRNTPSEELALVSVSPDGLDQDFPLHRDKLESGMVIGRDAASDIRIAHPSVSRRHARIYKSKHRIFVADLASTNGTKVNGKPAEGGSPFSVSDRLNIGSVSLKLVRSSGGRS